MVSSDPAWVLAELDQVQVAQVTAETLPALPSTLGGVCGLGHCQRLPVVAIPHTDHSACPDSTVAPLSMVAWADQLGPEPCPGRMQATTASQSTALWP